jgi:hypothetical protein
MRCLKLSAVVLTPLLLLDACATQPLSPTIGVMPATGKPFDVFQTDQLVCKDFGSQQVQGNAQQANNRQVGTAVLGTLLGAGLGAAIGGGRGAAIGAGGGAVGGTLFGAGPSASAQDSMQQRYDLAYAQCMYSRGNQVPGYLPPGAPPPPPAYAPGYQPRYYPAPPPPPGYQSNTSLTGIAKRFQADEIARKIRAGGFPRRWKRSRPSHPGRPNGALDERAP